MDIKNLNNNVVQNRANDAVKTNNKESSESKPQATVNTDKVTLTQALAQVSNLEQTARNVNADNAARIAELKAAIEDGSYQVDADRVADKLMQTEALFARF